MLPPARSLNWGKGRVLSQDEIQCARGHRKSMKHVIVPEFQVVPKKRWSVLPQTSTLPPSPTIPPRYIQPLSHEEERSADRFLPPQRIHTSFLPPGRLLSPSFSPPSMPPPPVTNGVAVGTVGKTQRAEQRCHVRMQKKTAGLLGLFMDQHQNPVPSCFWVGSGPDLAGHRLAGINERGQRSTEFVFAVMPAWEPRGAFHQSGPRQAEMMSLRKAVPSEMHTSRESHE
ncbi:hypothetical protein JZ751_021580 [Albula glossodonta]|uniref:Uncharacterized protein n=1 Tax=Albula glossodonta TaxID=121402 RepID=A0A8T2NVQ4_9TELE|nr:hypothetical protein JZ751_021580 [Albula glossodonta]